MRFPRSRSRCGTRGPRAEQGYVLLVTIVVGLVLAVSGAALLTRTLAGQLGAIRQQQGREAREIAETGLARTLASLNRDYPYLLINCYARQGAIPTACRGSWQQPFLPSSICPGANTQWSAMATAGSVGGTTTSPAGRYELQHYTFSGTQFYGGTATLRIRGQRLSPDGSRVLATAQVEQELAIKPKNCDAAFNQPPANTGFPGLLASIVDLGNNDVLGSISGNVLCLDCPSIEARVQELTSAGTSLGEALQIAGRESISAANNGFVEGSIFIGGNLAMPPVPQFPAGLSATPGEIDTTTTLTSGSTNGGRCAVDTASPPVTHCRITSIELQGSETLTITTTAGPMRLYVSDEVKLNGNAALLHLGPVQNLALFGNPRDSNNDNDQRIVLSGGATGSNLFVYAPDARVGINGGSDGRTPCNSSQGGDIRGAVWAKYWDLSSSTQAQLCVPDDMGAVLFRYFGPQYAISIRDYVALGSNRWGSFQQLP